MTYSSTSFYFMEHPRHEPETLGQDGVRTPQSHIRPLTAFPCAMSRSRSVEGASVLPRDLVRGRPMPPSSPLVSPSARSAGPSPPLPPRSIPFPIPRSSLPPRECVSSSNGFVPPSPRREGRIPNSQSISRRIQISVCAYPRVNIEETNGVTSAFLTASR